MTTVDAALLRSKSFYVEKKLGAIATTGTQSGFGRLLLRPRDGCRERSRVGHRPAPVAVGRPDRSWKENPAFQRGCKREKASTHSGFQRPSTESIR